MADTLSSAERVKLAYAGEEPDRVPIIFRSVDPWNGRWSGTVDRVQYFLAQGADAMLHVGSRTLMHPDVSTRVWREEAEPYPVLHKEYATPAGTLHCSVQITPDWQVADIPLYSDQAWPRGVDYLIKSEDDLPALEYILHDPSATDLTGYFESARAVRAQADELGVIVQGNMLPAPLYAMGLLGGMRSMMAVRDEPELLRALLERVHLWSTQSLELLVQTPVDVVYRSNCYETVDLFAPRDVREFFLPLLQADVGRCHQAGLPLHGFAQTGIMPFLTDWADAGVDIISSLDPIGPNCMDRAEAKRLVGDRCCLMGGVDNREPFIRGTVEQMEQAVIEALRLLAPGGGYILSPAGMIFPEGREENIRAFIEAGRRWGRYPLDLPD